MPERVGEVGTRQNCWRNEKRIGRGGWGREKKVPERGLKHPMYVLSKMELVGTGRPRKLPPTAVRPTTNRSRGGCFEAQSGKQVRNFVGRSAVV
jgi:hypothetical protein